METSEKYARGFSLSLKFALRMVIFNWHPTKLLQELCFTFSAEKDLAMPKIAERLGGLTSANAPLMTPQPSKQAFNLKIVLGQARNIEAVKQVSAKQSQRFRNPLYNAERTV